MDHFHKYLRMAQHTVTLPYPFYWPAYYTEGMYTEDAVPPRPRELFPVFHRSFDWHSCVHGFWCLTRILKVAPNTIGAEDSVATLARELTAEGLAGEKAALLRPEYKSFERPYGLGWLCSLAAELATWSDAPSPGLRTVVGPLAELAAERIISWHERLPYPIQTGEHSQSAFGLSLLRDYAVMTGQEALVKRVDAEVLRLYAADSLSILHAEPSGHDFLSPSLARAALVGAVVNRLMFSAWLARFLPGLSPASDPNLWLPIARGHVASDGKLSHLIGLNFSRAWMLRRIARKLAPEDGRVPVLHATAAIHAQAGHAATNSEHFESSHWLASFAVMDLTDEV